jgi:hypothetical protein
MGGGILFKRTVMNKNLKLFLMGMFGIMLAFSIVVMGCDNGSTDDDDDGTGTEKDGGDKDGGDKDGGKKITITGLESFKDQGKKVGVSLLSEFNLAEMDKMKEYVVAAGDEEISGDSVTISLREQIEGHPAWTGSTDSFYLGIAIGEGLSEGMEGMEHIYLYKNGQNISSPADIGVEMKISISAPNTPIKLSDCYEFPLQ